MIVAPDGFPKAIATAYEVPTEKGLNIVGFLQKYKTEVFITSSSFNQMTLQIFKPPKITALTKHLV